MNPMKLKKHARLGVAIFCGLCLSFFYPTTVTAAVKEKAKPDDPNVTQIHHLILRGAYSETPSSSLDLTSLVMGGAMSSKSYFKLAEHIDGLAKAKEIDCLVLDLSQPFSLSHQRWLLMGHLDRRKSRATRSNKNPRQLKPTSSSKAV